MYIRGELGEGGWMCSTKLVTRMKYADACTQVSGESMRRKNREMKK